MAEINTLNDKIVIKDIITIILGLTKFVPDRVYELTLGFNMGELETYNMSQVHFGKYCWHATKPENVKIGEFRFYSWSPGCIRHNIFLKGSTLLEFEILLSSIITEGARKHKEQLTTEKEKLNKALEKINNIVLK